MKTRTQLSARPIDGQQAPANGGGRWLWFPGILLLLALVYVALPYGRIASAVYIAAALLAAGVVATAAWRKHDLFCPAAWRLIAGALMLAGVGHAIWYGLDLYGLEPFPSVADAFYLAVYPLFAVALWKLGDNSGNRDAAISDALMLGISAAVLGWALLIAPYVYDPELTLLQLLVSTAYPVADLMLVPLLLRLVFLHRMRIRAHQLLLIGMLAYFAADLLYAHGNSTGWYVPGGFTDSLWLIAYALFVAAVWHPSASRVPQSKASSAELTGRRLFVLGGASILVPGVILFTAGDDVYIVRVAAIAAILLFLLVMQRMAGLIRKTHEQADALESLARTDPLTGAANRRRLETELAREMSRAERTGVPLGLAFLDVDHFKAYNDRHGHSAGDALLADMVTAWQQELRPADVLARFGGEEFVLVFPDTDAHACHAVVERLRGRVPHGQSCSAGIAVYQSGESADALLHRADQALYQAKNDGRDRTVMASIDAAAATAQRDA